MRRIRSLGCSRIILSARRPQLQSNSWSIRQALACRGARRFFASGGTDSLPPPRGITHSVENQSNKLQFQHSGRQDLTGTPYVRGQRFDAVRHDRCLRDGIQALGASWALKSHILPYSSFSGSYAAADLADRAHSSKPELQTHDRFGHRVDTIKYDPSYHALMDFAVKGCVPSLAWQHRGRPGSHVARAVLSMLHYQAEPGTGCPLTMTFAAVPALEHAGPRAEDWIRGALTPRYMAEDIPPQEKLAQGGGLTFGMSMSEKQGGSDVRANSTVAEPLEPRAGGGGAEPGDAFCLTGHKWFTSAGNSDAFLTLAQSPGNKGLSCFLVPRWMPDGRRNEGFRLMRLKNKLGDRSNASSEVEYDNAYGTLVGEEGRGVPAIIEMVVHTRLDCALGSASLMRAALQEASVHVIQREAFGAALGQQPLMQAVLAELAAESEAATMVALRLAAAFDDGTRRQAAAEAAEAGRSGATSAFQDGTMGGSADSLGFSGWGLDVLLEQAAMSDEEAAAFRRLATAVGKLSVCKRAPGVVTESMECLGGNGYTEDWPLARMYRQAPLNAIWEGSTNVQALDILRTLGKEPAALPAFLSVVARSKGSVSEGFDAALQSVVDTARWAAEGGSDGLQAMQWEARGLAETLYYLLAAHVLSLRARRAGAGSPEEACLRVFDRARAGGGRPNGAFGALWGADNSLRQACKTLVEHELSSHMHDGDAIE